MSAGEGRRSRTTLIKNKQELLEGRHVIDLTDERLSARRRQDYESTLGALAAIHDPDSGQQSRGVSRWWHRDKGKSQG